MADREPVSGGSSEISSPWIQQQWSRLPEALRAFLSGSFVFLALQAGWTIAFMVNTSVLPQVPWNVPVGLLYLWLGLRYFGGAGWPASTAARRRSALRAASPSREQWLWSLLYALLCLIFLNSIINVVYAFVSVPKADPMDTSMLPWWTLYPSLIMLSINAGVSEEAGFRGYMQGGLERRYGPVVAIVVTSVLFWIAHFNHNTGVSRFALLLGYGAALGALTWAARSIWPAIVTHAFCDAVSFLTLASGFGPRWFMKKPAPYAETGADLHLVLFSLLLVGSVLLGCTYCAGSGLSRRRHPRAETPGRARHRAFEGI